MRMTRRGFLSAMRRWAGGVVLATGLGPLVGPRLPEEERGKLPDVESWVVYTSGFSSPPGYMAELRAALDAATEKKVVRTVAIDPCHVYYDVAQSVPLPTGTVISQWTMETSHASYRGTTQGTKGPDRRE